MEEINKAYATFEERDRIASLGGGVDKIEKQHESGKMTARERIEMLLDKGTFVELDKLMVHRCTNYGMDKNKIPGDGIVSGYGKVDGRQVFVYAYDFTVYGGSLSASNAKKIVKVQQLALKNGAPIIALQYSETVTGSLCRLRCTPYFLVKVIQRISKEILLCIIELIQGKKMNALDLISGMSI